MNTSLYSYTSLTCLLVLIVILIKLFIKRLKDPVSVSFRVLIVTTFVYCLNDLLFGLFYRNITEATKILAYSTTFLYYLLGAVIAFLWSTLMVIYIDESLETHRKLAFFSSLPLLFIVGLLISNFSYNSVFSIQNNTFIKGKYKTLIYICDLLYYLNILFYGIFHSIKPSNTANHKEKAKFVFIYSSLPTIALLLQIFKTGAPFYTIGIVLSTLIIFTFISTSEFETVTVKRHEVENLKKIVENKKIIVSIANTYLSMHNFYLKENRYTTFKCPDFVNSFLSDPDDAQKDINNAMNGLTTPVYREKMMEFINIETVSERLGTNNEVSMEFLGNHSGWCVASWIRVANDDDGKCIQAVFAVRLIDEEKRREIEFERKFKQALMNENEVYGEILQNQSTGTIVINSNDKVIALNSSAAKYLNLSKAVIENCSLNTILSHFQAENKTKIIQKLNTIKVNGGCYTYEFESTIDEFTTLIFRADAKQLKLSNGEKVLIISITDITSNKQMEKELITLSETDSLTGINNRGSGEQKTEELLKNGKTGMLCLLDADKFKSINDTYGHQVGDRVIIEIANALKRSFRDRDILMRLGGDEFAMFAVGCVDQESANKCMERFFNNINNIQFKEFTDLKISVSVGCVLCTDIEKYSFDDYYQMADRAMYASKNKIGNFYTFYSIK